MAKLLKYNRSTFSVWAGTAGRERSSFQSGTERAERWPVFGQKTQETCAVPVERGNPLEGRFPSLPGGVPFRLFLRVGEVERQRLVKLKIPRREAPLEEVVQAVQSEMLT